MTTESAKRNMRKRGGRESRHRISEHLPARQVVWKAMESFVELGDPSTKLLRQWRCWGLQLRLLRCWWC